MVPKPTDRHLESTSGVVTKGPQPTQCRAPLSRMDTGEAVKVAGHKPDFELLLEQILVAVASTPPSEEQWAVCFAMRSRERCLWTPCDMLWVVRQASKGDTLCGHTPLPDAVEDWSGAGFHINSRCIWVSRP